MKRTSPVESRARRFQNREARRDTQKELADDLILAVFAPDHPEVLRIKAERKQKNPATPKRDGVGKGLREGALACASGYPEATWTKGVDPPGPGWLGRNECSNGAIRD